MLIPTTGTHSRGERIKGHSLGRQNGCGSNQLDGHWVEYQNYGISPSVQNGAIVWRPFLSCISKYVTDTQVLKLKVEALNSQPCTQYVLVVDQYLKVETSRFLSESIC